jgi:methionyl-tRNA formyltransferase
MKPLNIIFMGTPEFAVPSLFALHESGHHVSLVVTQPDRPRGRGRKLQPPPVKSAAMGLKYPVIQPESIKTADFYQQVKDPAPDVFVVIAYGHILSREILGIPTFGAINIHASLLPKYRGPAPIQWAIINQEVETGVTAMLMDPGLDTGDILRTDTTPIGPDDTSSTLHDLLAKKSAGLLIQTLIKVQQGNIERHPQKHDRATYAPLLKKADGRIDWHSPAAKIDAFVRGMSPWPGAFTFHGDKRLKIFSAKPVDSVATGPSGTVLKGFPDELTIASGAGALLIEEIQGASGKRLKIKDFLRGYPLPPGTRLG